MFYYIWQYTTYFNACSIILIINQVGNRVMIICTKNSFQLQNGKNWSSRVLFTFSLLILLLLTFLSRDVYPHALEQNSTLKNWTFRVVLVLCCILRWLGKKGGHIKSGSNLEQSQKQKTENFENFRKILLLLSPCGNYSHPSPIWLLFCFLANKVETKQRKQKKIFLCE